MNVERHLSAETGHTVDGLSEERVRVGVVLGKRRFEVAIPPPVSSGRG